MEPFRTKRSQHARSSSVSKITTIIDRSSDDVVDSYHALKYQFQKAESDSSSRGSNRTTLKHQLAIDSGQTTSETPVGNLMRSLLKDEMLKEAESRRRTPSVIAKLMGLDRMPSQNDVSKQPKRSSDSFRRQTVSAGTCRSYRETCKNQSCRKIAREQELVKDVYEVRESLKGQIEGYPCQMPLNRKHTEGELAFLRQKFMDAKRLSTHEKLQDSEEFQEDIDVLNSNNHLFRKLLREPDSLFSKHMDGTSQPHCRKFRNLKASKILDYNINAIGCQAGREGSQKIDISFSRHCQEGVRGYRSHMHAPDPDRHVTLPAEGTETASAAPTKIVLLKPSLGRSTGKSFSSSSPCEQWSDAKMHTTTRMHDRHCDAESCGKKRLPIDVNFSGHKSQESRELAKEITQQMKSRLGEGSFDMPLSGNNGYSADESSDDMSGKDSSNESDTTFLTSQTPNSSSFRGKSSSSSSRFTESSVRREGKKRLSERWKMTHRSQEIRMEKGTTLGEMLSMPDWEVRSPKLDGERGQDHSSARYDGNIRISGPVRPLGISSKDGWKDASIRSLSRSRSLPNTYDHIENPMKDVVLGTKEGSKHSRRKAVNRDSSLKDGSSSECRGRSDKRPYSSCRMTKESGNAEQEDQVGVSGNKSVLKEKDSLENKTVTLEAPNCQLDTILNLDSTREVVEHENFHVSPNFGGDVLPEAELSTDLQVKDDSSSGSLHKSTPKIVQPESPTSSKEADQPSPVSVLEVPFAEDPSSGSECFERVSADLHGLRMQLQLLKLESNGYDEGSLLIWSDEDETSEVAQGPTLSESKRREGSYTTESKSWKASYTADVLAEVELEDSHPNMVMITWNASQCPVGPWVFEKLEKKYTDEEHSCSRLERMLLFDRIKTGIMEIVQRSINTHPWVKTGVSPLWRKAWLETELYKVLANEAKIEGEKETTSVAGWALETDAEWMDLRMYIDGIGQEMGKLVLDELIAESFGDIN